MVPQRPTPNDPLTLLETMIDPLGLNNPSESSEHKISEDGCERAKQNVFAPSSDIPRRSLVPHVLADEPDSTSIRHAPTYQFMDSQTKTANNLLM